MSKTSPPPLSPPVEVPVLKYRIKYELNNNKAAVEIFYHETEKRIQGGKMSVIKAVKSRKIEGDPKDLQFLVDLLRFENPIIVINYEKGTFTLKTTGEEPSE